MKSIVWYSATGEIASTSVLPDSVDPAAMVQFFQGCEFVEGEGRTETHWVEGGTIVEYTEAQKVAKAARPQHESEWSNASMQWVDTRTLAQAKEARISAMKATRDATWDGTFDWNGHSFDCHLVARTNIIGRAVEAQMALAANTPWSTAWILADNTELTGITAADMLAIGAALGQHMDAAKARYTARKAAIEAAATIAEVDAVEW